jgi:protein-S-isoprenylcysteine O-methyltransferase Ste14
VDALETRVPPPIVMLIVGALMWVASAAAPAFGLPIAGKLGVALAVAIAAAGALVEGAGAVSFVRARTSVNPLDPCGASALVESGMYRFTRNPMYVGDLLLLVGWAVFLSNALAFLLVPVFVLYMDRFQIGPEERALADLFGERYAEYRGRVRRWV